jgi:hypothetical protein
VAFVELNVESFLAAAMLRYLFSEDYLHANLLLNLIPCFGGALNAATVHPAKYENAFINVFIRLNVKQKSNL